MDEAVIDRVKQSLQQHAQSDDNVAALADDPALQFSPIEDEHFNDVCKVTNSDGSVSCLVVHYPEYTKLLGQEMPIEADRCCREYEACQYFSTVVENCCPRVHFCDQQNSIVCFEFLSTHRRWGNTLEISCDLHLGARIADILVQLHSRSHLGHVSPEDFEKLKEKFLPYPKLSSLLSDCHFTKPFSDEHHVSELAKDIPAEVKDKLKDVLGDSVVLKATQLTSEWMAVDEGTCVVHGNLHVNSIVVSPDHEDVRLINLDCSRIGPGAYDVAMLVCNYVLFYHYHQECSREEKDELVDHEQHMTEAIDLICITLSRYMEGMSRSLGEDFDKHHVWRQILLYLGVEIIAWIAVPSCLKVLKPYPNAQINCLNTALRILHKQSLSLDTAGLTKLIHQHP